MQKEGYILPENRKKILFLCDDFNLTSGVATMAREIIHGTCHHYNWLSIGAAINHPHHGQKLDMSERVRSESGVEDANVTLYPYNGYGDANILRHLLREEKPDAILFFTDPRYFDWLFKIENEIRKQCPLIYYNIWDSLPAPLYNKPFYESCDALLAISKQTKGINEMVLGKDGENKIIEYVPHGIDKNKFFPIRDENEIEKWKIQYLKKSPKFVAFFNSRNISRKHIGDLLAGWKLFLDNLTPEQAEDTALILHTDPIDNNGTDLYAVRELLFGKTSNIFFSDKKTGTKELNHLYNIADVTILPSSNEGWGLSLTESMMAGTMIIATVTGGMQDQMRFEDENGNWVKLDKDFPSNHFGTIKKCGNWAIPVFPNNSSLVGSPLTPYIWDDRLDFRDLSQAILKSYNLDKETRNQYGDEARNWVISDEAGMSSNVMCSNMIKWVDKSIETFIPKKSFELIQAVDLEVKGLIHTLVY